jgi:hypothetical protein
MVAPNAITSSTGNYAACIGSSITYTVGMPVLTATQRAASVYRWTVPVNTTITSAASDSSNITLQYNIGFVGGSISVKSQSSCGTQSATAKTITLTTALAPLPVSITSSTGNLSGCIGSTINYTAAPGTASLTQQSTAVFRWTLPANTTITSASSSGGVDSAVVTLQFNAGYTGGVLSVKGQTACGFQGVAKTATLIAPYLAPTPSSITSGTSSYNACIGESKTYTAVSPTPSALQRAAVVIRWTVPANTTITGATSVGGVDSASITVSFNTGYVGGNVTARGITGCGGIGAVKTQALTHNGCASGSRSIIPIAKVDPLVAPSEEMNVLVFPNPTTNQFNVKVASGNAEALSIRVLDLQGRVLKTLKATVNQNVNIGSDLKSGTYFIETRQGKEVKTTRVIKF